MIAAVGTNQIPRLQLGIGRPSSREPEAVASYVLSAFSRAEREGLAGAFVKGEALLRERGYL